MKLEAAVELCPKYIFGPAATAPTSSPRLNDTALDGVEVGVLIFAEK